MNGSMAAAGCLVALAFLHSALGERVVLGPLLAQEWVVGHPRNVIDRILRFAWHLTSLAWLGLAAVVVGAEPAVAVGVVRLASAAVVFFALRSHLAWPLFLLAGVAALDHGDVLPSWYRPAAGIVAIAGLAVAAALHLYWVLGGQWMADRAIPTHPGPASSTAATAVFLPGPVATAAVAGALLVMAAAIGAATVGTGGALVRVVGWVGVALFALRVVGDGRFIGFTKSIRSTPFARADDRIFTPLIVLLALAATGGLLSTM